MRTGFSVATAVGGGKRLAPAGARERLFDLALRADVLFGPAAPDALWSLGPAFELRTADFDTLEVSGGAHLRLRLAGPLSMWTVVGGGKKYLPQEREGGLLMTTLGIGARLEGYRDGCIRPVCYEPRFGAYVTLRQGIAGDDDVREVTAGVELDIAVLVILLSVLGRGG